MRSLRLARPGLIVAAASLLPCLAAPCRADPLVTDRPGIGSSPETVPQGTLQGEIGTDGTEIRFGLLPGAEVDHDDSGWAVKAQLFRDGKFSASGRLNYDGHVVGIEVPASVSITPWASLALDASWSRDGDVYAAGLGISPAQRLTLTPMIYHDGRFHAAIFTAWVVPGRDNMQVDIGFDQDRINAGLSIAFDGGSIIHRLGV